MISITLLSCGIVCILIKMNGLWAPMMSINKKNKNKNIYIYILLQRDLSQNNPEMKAFVWHQHSAPEA